MKGLLSIAGKMVSNAYVLADDVVAGVLCSSLMMMLVMMLMVVLFVLHDDGDVNSDADSDFLLTNILKTRPALRPVF